MSQNHYTPSEITAVRAYCDRKFPEGKCGFPDDVICSPSGCGPDIAAGLAGHHQGQLGRAGLTLGDVTTFDFSKKPLTAAGRDAAVRVLGAPVVEALEHPPGGETQ